MNICLDKFTPIPDHFFPSMTSDKHWTVLTYMNRIPFSGAAKGESAWVDFTMYGVS